MDGLVIFYHFHYIYYNYIYIYYYFIHLIISQINMQYFLMSMVAMLIFYLTHFMGILLI
jgi:hypothetical protein